MTVDLTKFTYIDEDSSALTKPPPSPTINVTGTMTFEVPEQLVEHLVKVVREVFKEGEKQ